MPARKECAAQDGARRRHCHGKKETHGAATPTVAVNKQISISRVQNILKQIIREFMHILLFLMQTFVVAHTKMI